MYIVNGLCMYSGTDELAYSAALTTASLLTMPGHALVSVTVTDHTSATAIYTDGTTGTSLPITLHYATDHQCAFAGDFAAIPPAAVDLGLTIIFTLIGGLMLCAALLSFR